MNLHHAMFILLLVSILLSGHHAAQAAEPLNVVFILPDDLGCRDLGCYGSTFYETPTIDGFAREGIRLTAA